VLLDGDRITRQLLHLVILEREALAVLRRDLHLLHRLAGPGLGIEHHLDRLGAEPAPQDRRLAVGEAQLRDIELVRIHRALHHHLAQAVARRDEHHVAEAGLGVHREHHAGRALVAAHHALHARGDRDLAMAEALVHAVGDGAVVVERGEDAAHRVEHVVRPADVEVGLLLPGERRIGQVLRGGG
jgi:hypothetical protein